jgi:SnoaL-like protein
MTLAVADRLALADLVHLYAAAVDDRRFGDVVELFTETTELRLPDPPRSLEAVRHHTGRDGVRTAMAALSGLARTQHEIVGEVYAPGSDPDYALGRITCVAHHFSISDEQVTDLVWHLRYDDEYLRTRSGWRIHGRALTINAIETRPIRRLRPHPSTDREAAADPSAASTAPQSRKTMPPGRSPGTP